MFWRWCLTGALVCLMVGCHHSAVYYGDTDSLSHLQQLKPGSRDNLRNQISPMRQEVLRDTAMSIGAQSGLAWRMSVIQNTLKQRERDMDRIFNFDALVLPNHVLPPVLEEGRQAMNVASNDVIRLSDRTYRIVQQAAFVSHPPRWRDYLWQEYTKPERPNPSLLPTNKKERQLWAQYVKEGWNYGVEQADGVFSANLARLKRDYQGMVLYRVLLEQGMVSPPYVAHSHLGVTGGGSEMRVNDQVLRITALPRLNAESKRWQAVARDPH